MERFLSSRAEQYASEKYQNTLPLLKRKASEILNCMEGLAGDEKILMEFLYGTMPICDAADYEPQLIYAYVRHALFLRKEKEWTKKLPEDIFLNYVLYYRVNNEDITDCRGWFYEMLWPLVEGLSCEEAVKAINYWCGQQASYTASDGRTLGPVGVFKSGSGRCGEESTFLVTALRSVGIAARQVYTPRWAHCDDNHAWVEAYVEDGWRFLGACEPEEVLNKGWFTNASSRAMMIHTRVFSDYQSADAGKKEEITERDGAALFFNDTQLYAKTGRLTVKVKDDKGKAVLRAKVSFALLNGAEYYAVSTLYTDEKGMVSLKMGLGSVLLHVSKGKCCSEKLIWVQEDTAAEVVLAREAWQQSLKTMEKDWQYIEHAAPRESAMHPVKLTKEQKARGREKRLEAERLRREKLESFQNPTFTAKYQEAQEILELSYGNSKEICRFLEAYPEKEAVEFLSVLSKKDYRDIHADLLAEHFDYGLQVKDYSYSVCLKDEEQPEELFLNYVWNPRIRYEMITPYRSFITDFLTDEQKEAFCKEPERIWKWIQEEIACEESRNYHSVVTSPAGVLRTGQGSALSQKTLFVAICRTLGIPARLNPVNQEAEYFKAHAFHDVSSSEWEKEEFYLKLHCQEEPEYYVSWTIGRLVQEAEKETGEFYSRFETLNFAGREFQHGELILQLPEGIYQLITAVRLPNGNQLEARRIVNTDSFLPGAGGKKECTMELLLRKPRLNQMLENLPLENFILYKKDRNLFSPIHFEPAEKNRGLEDEAGAGEAGAGEAGARKAEEAETEITASEIISGRTAHTMLAFLEEGMEPTEHFLNELKEQAEEVKQSGLQLVFVVSSKEAFQNPTLASALECLPASVYYDSFEELPELLARRMYTNPERLPLVLLISPDRKGRYASSGYNVGSVGLMLRIAKMLMNEKEI